MNVDGRPPRGMLKNLDNGEEHEFLFNPESISEKVSTKWNRHNVVGLSHEVLSYKNTANVVLNIELFMSQLAQDELSGSAGSHPLVATERRAFLYSLMYPMEDEDYDYRGAPRVLFIWPTMFRMKCIVADLDFTHREFSQKTLATTQLVAKVTLEGELDSRLLSSTVARIHTLRYPLEGGPSAAT